ncbi:hypothetical protein lerEdw1_009625 [Lerista edwardsae]|nr:hypothetical protein lerEdw1_009625 [Lerista edwardsae]
MQTFLGLFICFVLITAGTALECEVCGGLGTGCTGNLETCESDKDTCVIVLSVNTLVDTPIESVAKACGFSSGCRYGPKYLNFGQGKGLRSSTTCCVGEACRRVTPQLPPTNTTRNGKRCPACYTTQSHQRCNEREKVDCVGPEDHCLDMAMTITYGTVVLNSIQRGCASKSICDELKIGETNASQAQKLTLFVFSECRAGGCIPEPAGHALSCPHIQHFSTKDSAELKEDSTTSFGTTQGRVTLPPENDLALLKRLALFFPPGTALECEVCSNPGTNCTGSLQTCEAGHDTCIIIRNVNTQFGFPRESIKKMCAPSSVCKDEPKYISYGQGKGIRLIFLCCVGEACKRATLQLPPATRNGKRCSACYVTSSSHWCDKSETVDCVGPEDHCLDMTMRMTYGTVTNTIVQKGCVSKSICEELPIYEAITPRVKVNGSCNMKDIAEGAMNDPEFIVVAGKPMFVCSYMILFEYCYRHFDLENLCHPQSIPVNMRVLLEVFLFSVLLRTGTCLECEVCSAIGSTCTGSMETCDVGQDTCAAIFSENSLAGMPIQTVVKSCEASSACSSSLPYMNFGHGKYVRTSMSCCVGDACKTASPNFPPAATEPNGKQCPGCYSLSPFGCEAETVECAGAEDFCLDMVQEMKYGKFVIHTTMKGCATEAVCAAKEGEVTSAGVHVNIMKAECKPASLEA